MPKRILTAALFLLCLLAGSALADRVVLNDGRTLTGKVVQKGGKVIVKTPGGDVTVDLGRVREIEYGDDLAPEYERRAAKVDFNDFDAHVALAGWCEKNGLVQRAYYHYYNALRIAPEDPGLRKKLGFEWSGGRWVCYGQRQREKGLVKYDGKWMTPEEKQDIIDEKNSLEEEPLTRAEKLKQKREREALEKTRERMERDLSDVGDAQKDLRPAASGDEPWWKRAGGYKKREGKK